METIIRANDVLRSDWLAEYEKLRTILHRELVTFNTRLFTLEKLDTFPFELFIPLYDDRIFWQTARNALIEATVMVAWRIVLDPDADTFTLQRFHDEIFKNLRDVNARDHLSARMREIDFKNRVKDLGDKIKNARHNHLAHLNRQLQLTPPQPQDMEKLALRLDDLKSLLEATRELFNALCFSHRHELWLMAYSERTRREKQTDIDELLDTIVRSSRIFNLAETDWDSWLRLKVTLSNKQLDILNEYRVRFGLSKLN